MCIRISVFEADIFYKSLSTGDHIRLLYFPYVNFVLQNLEMEPWTLIVWPFLSTHEVTKHMSSFRNKTFLEKRPTNWTLYSFPILFFICVWWCRRIKFIHFWRTIFLNYVRSLIAMCFFRKKWIDIKLFEAIILWFTNSELKNTAFLHSLNFKS